MLGVSFINKQYQKNEVNIKVSIHELKITNPVSHFDFLSDQMKDQIKFHLK
jgi:hypothetical protein